jgi:outer membrane protein OmpA-like peptidoglycan-associated protein
MARATITLPFAALLAFPASASALEVGVRLEPGLAVPLAAPQSQRFTLGGDVSLKAYLGLGRFFDVQAGVSWLAVGASSGTVPSSAGTAWSDSLGFRFKRPHDAAIDRAGFYAASPWIDGDALYVRTGGLDRFGVTVGAGVSWPLDTRRHVWLGPSVRYMDIVQPSNQGFDDTDAKVFLIGANLEIGTSPLPRRPVECPTCESCPPCGSVMVVAAPDRDFDTVPDSIDLCPDVPGPVENGGCPVYKKVIVRPDKIELREKILFAFDRSEIEPESHPLLDEVAQALKDNKGFRVMIEGNTDSTGPREHNQTLSEDRARAVLGYLRDHGIAGERLSYRGFGSSEPTETNTTVAGREANRRVEFIVQLKIVDRSGK